MELHFNRPNGPSELIHNLVNVAGGVHHPDIVREMLLATLKAGQDAERRADLKMMNATLKEMRFTTKIFGPYRHRRKVAVFGAARIPKSRDHGHPYDPTPLTRFLFFRQLI